MMVFTRVARSTAAALFLAALLPGAGFGMAHQATSDGLIFSIDDATGSYTLEDGALRFGGRLPHGGAVHVTRSGAELRFALAEGIEASVAPAPGGSRALVFSWQVIGPNAVAPPRDFPDFTSVPAGLHSFSHRQVNFAPPSFDAAQEASTPWLLYSESGRNAVLVSPAAAFFLASMHGDARSRVAVGLNAEAHTLPPGFTLKTLVAAGPGIIAAYDAWGAALRSLYGRSPAAADADPTLRYIGVLTDNAGGHYYYNYEYAAGLNYEESLVRFIERSRAAGIPFGYLQLDSWWYHKSTWNPHEQIGGVKNPALPAEDWNRYGGVVEWTAHPGVFPRGMAAFHERVQLPFFAHNRFIDKDSPYHQRYEISGVAAVDRRFWNELADYAARSGIAVYLQDWLDATYKYSPELHSVPGKGEAFMDGMAAAMAAHGITMQYCMAYPLHMLQGAKYPNLTTIRAAGDGLTRDRWLQLTFNARFIRALGAWPATDVMSSGDAAAMLFATLSGGPVGIGDAFEKLDRSNIFLAARTDGEIVKPDEPLAPLERSYLAQAHRSAEPIIATTFTRHGSHTTAYLLAFAAEVAQGTADFAVTPGELGFGGAVAVLDPAAGSVRSVDARGKIAASVSGPDAFAYRVVAPVAESSGIAVFGDLGKFVPMGRKRVTAVAEDGDGVQLKLAFAPKESQLTIGGYARSAIAAQAEGATVVSTERDSKSGLFKVQLRREADGPAEATLTLRRAKRDARP